MGNEINGLNSANAILRTDLSEGSAILPKETELISQTNIFNLSTTGFQERNGVDQGGLFKAKLNLVNAKATTQIPRMDARSEAELAKVNPELANRIRQTAATLKAQGINIVVAPKGGLRTFAEQNALYAQGRNGNPGNVVTNAKGGESYHNYGLAIDIVPTDAKGNPTWSAPDKTWKAIGAAGKQQGLEWGGDWKSIKDTPHFQMAGTTKHASDLIPVYNKGGLQAVWNQVNKGYPQTTTPTAPTTPTTPNKNGVNINNVPNFSQSDARWGKEPYKLNPALGNFAGNGCTVTAASIAASWATGKTVSPSQANANFGGTINQFQSRDLSGHNATFGNTFGAINKNSTQANALLDKVKDSIKSGHPVVLGISGSVKTPDGANWGRHTVVATGIDKNGQILVNDPATGKQQPLSAFKFNNLDMAFEISKKGGAGGTVTGGQTTTQTPTTPTTPQTPQTPTTQTSLPVPTARLEKGTHGEQVKQLQHALVKLGYMTQAQMNTGPGTFGPRTDAAVRSFQRSHNLVPDGIYGPKTQAALTKALGGSVKPPTTAPTAPTTPTNPANTTAQGRNIDKILRGTGLEGKGEVIAQLAKKYNVPPEFAIAMFRKEASFAQNGTLADRNNNPGNIRFANQSGAVNGAAGFAKWGTMDQGIEGFFKLMNNQPYRGFIDRKDYASVINRYAPPSENNTNQYIADIKGWIDGYRQKINA